MAQTRNNNLTCLPLYKAEGEISSNLPWAFGDVFPLRCDKRLLPFFGLRTKSTTLGGGDEILNTDYDDACYIDDTGTIGYVTGAAYGVAFYEDVASYLVDVGAREKAVWVDELPAPLQVEGVTTCNAAWFDASGNLLRTETLGDGLDYSGFIFAPSNGAELRIQVWSGASEDTVLRKVADVIRPIKTAILEDGEGNQTEISVEGMIDVVNIGDKDLFYYSGNYNLLSGVDRGTYRMYLRAGSLPDDRYFSDWFTLGGVPNVRIEWYDATDQQLEEGYIPYSLGYKNRLYLNASVGFPEYEIDKEGDERDGYFFMEKGVSRKSYKMQFYGPEYLCDVLRLVPVSDYVKIYDTSRGKEIEYDVDDIDMEVEWQEQGNYAAITLTFKTDTVIKNLGKIV